MLKSGDEDSVAAAAGENDDDDDDDDDDGEECDVLSALQWFGRCDPQTLLTAGNATFIVQRPAPATHDPLDCS